MMLVSRITLINITLVVETLYLKPFVFHCPLQCNCAIVTAVAEHSSSQRGTAWLTVVTWLVEATLTHKERH